MGEAPGRPRETQQRWETRWAVCLAGETVARGHCQGCDVTVARGGTLAPALPRRLCISGGGGAGRPGGRKRSFPWRSSLYLRVVQG